jgi:predicted phage terminase large subunit-like protein
MIHTIREITAENMKLRLKAPNTKDEIQGLILVEPKGGKLARVTAMSPLLEAGNLWLPKPEKAPWVNEFVDTCAAFPSVAHDDDVDAMSQAILDLGGDPRKRLMDLLKD